MQREKPPEVLLCGLYQRSQIPQDHKLSKLDNLDNTRKGNMPAFHLLAAYSDEPGYKRELSVVDLSQAFARFFMRVGLPHDVPLLRS